MSVKTHDRLPTTGPDAGDYSRYQYIVTDEGTTIHDSEGDSEEAWIRSDQAVALKAVR